MNIYIYIYIVPKFQIRHWDQDSNVKVNSHKTTSPDTHRHFLPASKQSLTFPVDCARFGND